MALADEAIRHLKDKLVVVVTSLESEGYQQEIVGILVDGGEGCLVVQQGEGASPTIINAEYVAWVYEDTGEREEEE